jgi:hypothetical protein
MIPASDCHYERLGIHRIIVNCCGNAVEVPASAVVSDWESKRYALVSGPKSPHFIVVCSTGVCIASTKCFFPELKHIDRLLQFGNLSLFPRFEAFYEIASEGISAFIHEFFTDQVLSEFQQSPILTFIVEPTIFETDFTPHSIISYVRPDSVAIASADKIKTFALVVYSRIRVFTPAPFEMIDIMPRDCAAFFFPHLTCCPNHAAKLLDSLSPLTFSVFAFLLVAGGCAMCTSTRMVWGEVNDDQVEKTILNEEINKSFRMSAGCTPAAIVDVLRW